MTGRERFDYPDWHIEADNRLSWFLGALDLAFPDAYYVHLRRDREAVASSFVARWDSPFPASMIRAFAHGVLMNPEAWADRMAVCRFYVDTVTTNIEHFLKGRRHETMWLESAAETFPAFLDRIGAKGDLDAALAEWGHRYNATKVRSQTTD